ncbi:MAG: histidine kinase [Gaiellaceae bacterium]
MDANGRTQYQAWLAGELALLGLLAAAFATFAAYETLQTAYELPELRLVIGTTVMLAGFVVALLAGARFVVDGYRTDLLLSCGFFAGALGTAVFAISPTLGGHPVGSPEGWADIGSRLLAGALIAAAPFVSGRKPRPDRSLAFAFAASAVTLGLAWAVASSLEPLLPSLAEADATPPVGLVFAYSLQAFLALVALVGFGLRFRGHGEDLDGWLALGATFLLFSALVFVFTPVAPSDFVSQGDFLRVLGYGVLLVGVWRAIRAAEFGRAVADERARVAREIHDGLAQYLFAVSTHASMLENGAPPEETLPQLKEAAALAQQEARFAVLALSSAAGTAPFDAALRRYVEFLTADGALDVELEIDNGLLLAPDEQIEVFRIVQEGLANVRKHAGASRAEVRIGEIAGRRLVRVLDDGQGFEPGDNGAGQGLKNIRRRAESIEGSFQLRSRPGRGTALEVVLRA